MRNHSLKSLGVRTGTKGSRLQPYFTQPAVVGNIALTTDEPSSICRSTLAANRGYIWLEEDSGNASDFVAINYTTAAVAGRWSLQGVTQVDFEDCASARINNISYLYMADMGNNGNALNSRGTGIDLAIFRCKEPTITGSNGTLLSTDIERIDCVFPAGNTPTLRDAEAFFVDPSTGDMYLVTKRIFPAQVFKLAHANSYAGIQTLTYLGKVACDTSATSITIGTGAKTFTTVRGFAFPVRMKLRVCSRANAANFMEGTVTANSGNSLTIYVEVNSPTLSEAQLGGSGTLTDWDITLPTSFTPTGNNGCFTGGDMSPNGTEIVFCNYGWAYIFQRDKNRTIYQALDAAPLLLTSAGPGSAFYSHNNVPVPGFPQREAIAFQDETGTILLSNSEYNAGSGSINPLVRYTRCTKPVTTVVLQQGLNGYSQASDTFIGSGAPGTPQGTAVLNICDYDYQGATTFSAAATAAAGAQTTFTVAVATGAVVGRLVTISGSSVAGYNGDWEVTVVAGLSITVDVPFISTATGSFNPHTQDRQVLLKFADLSMIPSNATIVDATLRIFDNVEGQGWSVHRMLVTWADTATFTSLGVLSPNRGTRIATTTDAEAYPTISDTYVGFYDMPLVLATIQGWVNGTYPNYGWAIIPHRLETTGDGFQLDSCESATQSRKPSLTISYTV